MVEFKLQHHSTLTDHKMSADLLNQLEQTQTHSLTLELGEHFVDTPLSTEDSLYHREGSIS